MWMLDNQTPYEAERTWVRDKEGAHHWIVVVKGSRTISVRTVPLGLAKKPLAPSLHPTGTMARMGSPACAMGPIW